MAYVQIKKARTCLHCDTEIPIETGYSFDKDLSIICGKCGKVAYSTTWNTESSTEMIAAKRAAVSGTTTTHYGNGYSDA